MAKRAAVALTPHSLRRGFVVEYLAHGGDIATLMIIGGWSSEVMIYRYLGEARARTAQDVRPGRRPSDRRRYQPRAARPAGRAMTSEQVRDIYTRLERLERLDEQFATVTAALTRIDGRLNSLETKVDRNRDEVLHMRDVLGGRFDEISAVLADIRAQL